MSVVAWLFVVAAIALLVVAPTCQCRRAFIFALAFTLAYSIVPFTGATS